jgi:hypothetical protein
LLLLFLRDYRLGIEVFVVVVGMDLTESVFNRNARLLIRALEIDTDEKTVDTISVENNGSAFRLRQWRLECDDEKNPNSTYLIHPTVEMVTPRANVTDGLVQNTAELDIYKEILLEDNTIPVDEQVVVIQKGQADNSMDVTTQWTFSIVYSITYRAPVLYFHVQSPSGDPCGRQGVMQILRNISVVGTDKIPNETWEFVSQEEHPFSGYPSFFLHPCQSSDRLKLMTIQHKNFAGDGEEADGSLVESVNNTNVIWAWMSMIFPVVGHAVPSGYYIKIGRRIAELGENA